MERFRVIQVGAGQMVHSEHLMRAMRRRAELFEVAGIVVEDEARWAKVRDQETFRGLERFTWEEAVARADMLPKVAAMGGYMVSNPSLKNGFEKQWNGYWGVGVVVNVPIFHGFEALKDIPHMTCSNFTIATLRRFSRSIPGTRGSSRLARPMTTRI